MILETLKAEKRATFEEISNISEKAKISVLEDQVDYADEINTHLETLKNLDELIGLASQVDRANDVLKNEISYEDDAFHYSDDTKILALNVLDRPKEKYQVFIGGDGELDRHKNFNCVDEAFEYFIKEIFNI